MNQFGLTSREIDVLRLLVQGQSDGRLRTPSSSACARWKPISNLAETRGAEPLQLQPRRPERSRSTPVHRIRKYGDTRRRPLATSVPRFRRSHDVRSVVRTAIWSVERTVTRPAGTHQEADREMMTDPHELQSERSVDSRELGRGRALSQPDSSGRCSRAARVPPGSPVTPADKAGPRSGAAALTSPGLAGPSSTSAVIQQSNRSAGENPAPCA